MDTSILDTKRLILIKGGKLAHLYANGYLPSAEKTFVTFFQRKKNGTTSLEWAQLTWSIYNCSLIYTAASGLSTPRSKFLQMLPLQAGEMVIPVWQYSKFL